MNKIISITKNSKSKTYSILMESITEFDVEDEGNTFRLDYYISMENEDIEGVIDECNYLVKSLIGFRDFLIQIKENFPNIDITVEGWEDEHEIGKSIYWKKEDWNEIYNKYKPL